MVEIRMKDFSCRPVSLTPCWERFFSRHFLVWHFVQYPIWNFQKYLTSFGHFWMHSYVLSTEFGRMCHHYDSKTFECSGINFVFKKKCWCFSSQRNVVNQHFVIFFLLIANFYQINGCKIVRFRWKIHEKIKFSFQI